MATWYEQDGVNAGWTVGRSQDGTSTRERVRLDWIEYLGDEDKAALAQEAARRGMTLWEYASWLAHMPSAEFRDHQRQYDAGDLLWAVQALRTALIERQSLISRPGRTAAWLGE